jgi:hypothetical protein
VKGQVAICLTILCLALLVNAGTRYFAWHAENTQLRPGNAVPPINFTPAGSVAAERKVGVREPALAGDLLVLVLETRSLGDGDDWLRRELEVFHTQYGQKERFLGGSIYVVDGTGKVRPWAPGQALAAGSAAFACGDVKDFQQSFTVVRSVLDDFGRHAETPVQTLLVWRSELYLDPETDLGGVPRPGRPLMLFWVDRLAESPAIDAWLGKGSITPVERGKGKLAANMDFYVRSLAK